MVVDPHLLLLTPQQLALLTMNMRTITLVFLGIQDIFQLP